MGCWAATMLAATGDGKRQDQGTMDGMSVIRVISAGPGLDGPAGGGLAGWGMLIWTGLAGGQQPIPEREARAGQGRAEVLLAR